ncbi:hypothetical protein LMG27952_06746 [Paraburkholderia hiiakae]|uniref:Uncharacterized protein n=1 Tax=Paraburkholderia hiiakae TaxID=1081782 RepID=A0ABN7IIH3_9BURK|nr:hypothetical protein LMG27952_06746 [Paraburkholderia hiiakae]
MRSAHCATGSQMLQGVHKERANVWRHWPFFNHTMRRNGSSDQKSDQNSSVAFATKVRVADGIT